MGYKETETNDEDDSQREGQQHRNTLDSLPLIDRRDHRQGQGVCKNNGRTSNLVTHFYHWDNQSKPIETGMDG